MLSEDFSEVEVDELASYDVDAAANAEAAFGCLEDLEGKGAAAGDDTVEAGGTAGAGVVAFGDFEVRDAGGEFVQYVFFREDDEAIVPALVGHDLLGGREARVTVTVRKTAASFWLARPWAYAAVVRGVRRNADTSTVDVSVDELKFAIKSSVIDIVGEGEWWETLFSETSREQLFDLLRWMN